LFSLIISDVVGDPLDVIASGPTAPDPTRFEDALNVLAKHNLLEKAPQAVLKYLREGAEGEHPETPKSLSGNIHNQVIGNNSTAVAAAIARAAGLGYRTINLGSSIAGDTALAARSISDRARNSLRDCSSAEVNSLTCLVSGGETTVALGGKHGLGGRNQEFVLASLVYLGDRITNLLILSAGTDGEDGPTDAAGAMAVINTLYRARELGLDAGDFLEHHDAYHFFEATGDLIKTGLTGTNVMDLRIILAR
jgi:hydroxypyruvate reductase/glycerate 2-kinase